MARLITQRVTFNVKESLDVIDAQFKDLGTDRVTLTDVNDGSVIVFKSHIVAIYERE